MDIATLLSIAIPLGTFLIGHYHLILPASKPPTTFGHGELIQYLLQMIASGPATPAPSTPSAPANSSTEWLALLSRVIAVLEKQNAPAPVAKQPLV